MTLPLIILLLLTLLVATFLPRKEYFQTDNNKTILTSNRLNYEHLYPGRLISIADKAWSFVLFKLYTNQQLDLFGSPGQVILHPVDYLENVKQAYPKEEVTGHFLFLTSPQKADEFQCGFDIGGRRVGYFDRVEKRLIDSIAFGYRQKTTPVLLEIGDLDKLDSIWNKVDVLVLYVVPKSPLLRLVEKQYLTLLDIRSIDIARLQLTNNYLTLQELYKRDLFVTDNRLVSPGETIMVLTMPTYVVTLSMPKPIPLIGSVSETFITRLDTSKEFSDPNYRCVGDENIQSVKECTSPYSKIGQPKSGPTFMDKPCKKNADCPYYRANKNYYNDFGRCMPDGKCQLPLGMMRMGYTKAYDRGVYAPFCYGCSNPRDTMCCEDQSVLIARKQSPLKSPDYAFAGDTELRTLNKLSTYIPLL